MTQKTKNKVGKAYAFFDCKAPQREIAETIPRIRTFVGSPNKLELTLSKIHSSGAESPKATRVAYKTKQTDRKYAIEATCPEATNEQTADELGAVLNQAYQSDLYRPGEAFKGNIVYETTNWLGFSKYVFRN